MVFFRFENKWLKEPDLEETVIDGWGANDNIAIVDRVARCANKLQKWGKRKRVKFKQEIEECVCEMEALRDNQGDAENRRFQECSDRHATLLVQEEGGCIPTRRRLLERYVDCDVYSPLCEDEVVEDDVHTFFTCVSAQSSWQAAGLSSVLGSAACQQGSVTDKVFALCRNEDYATIGRVATLLWSI
ncbi:unnamed protein product [Trifolium pratense]|uniref:Uncharacterized protein n=1 Tax=Trifolium pratense TaxID=57577 RepID=A0ACB0IYZ7_TRIPR|nr:unnamed protein product [Trifolium pratense]